MNRYVRNLVYLFREEKNITMLRGVISGHFKNSRVDTYLRTQFPQSVADFAQSLEQELMDSEPLSHVSVYDELAIVNQRFIDHQTDFIRDHISPEKIPIYSVNDGRPTTRIGTDKTAPQLLDAWWYARRQPQFRDDPAEHGAVKCDLGGTEVTGVTFCDQSGVGLQNHIDQYENTSTKFALNKSLPHETTVFGVSTPASDARLLSRRIFRSEGGVENGFPVRQKVLHHRNYDRDADETMYTGLGCHVRGYDMEPVRRKIDNLRKPRDPPRMDLRVPAGPYPRGC